MTSKCYYIQHLPKAWICPFYKAERTPTQEDCENCLKARELYLKQKEAET